MTPRVARTIKFLSGISVCDCVVTPKWVEESGKRGTFLPEGDFFLRDPDAEQLFGMNLLSSLSRARETKLLEGLSVFATASVQPPFSALGEIVQCAGGELLTVAQVRTVLAEGGEGRSDRVVVLSTPVDIEAGACREFTSKGMSK